MRELAQTFLVIGGGLGLFVAVPAAIYGWLMQRGFGGDLTSKDNLLLYSLIVCVMALAFGIAWRKFSTTKSRRDRFKLTEDGGAASDVGGFE